MNLETCRICLISDFNLLIDMFAMPDSPAEKIRYCAGVEITKDDQLPQKICRNCLNSISIACEIKEKCIATDQILRQKLKDEDIIDHCVMINCSLKEEEVDERMSFEVLHVGFLKSQSKPDEKCVKKVKRKRFKQNQPVDKKSKESRRSKTKAEDFRCFICDKLFLKVCDKNQHIKVDHAMVLSCKVCKSKKPSSISTEKCIKDHEMGFDYLCQICAKPFRHKYYLQKHQATFHAEASTSDIFTCDSCGLQTKYKMNLYRHIKSVHLNSHKFPCPYSVQCGDIVYTTKEGLNIHLYRIHNVLAPVTCSTCQLGFSFVSELKVHRKVCAGISKPGSGAKNRNFKQFCEVIDEGFRCKVCQKVFAEKQNWSYHYSSSHRNNRTCEICNKEFTNYTNFYRHVNVQHKKIKKFHCDYPGCEKSFGQKGSLMNHRNTHTGEKPFSCNFCSFRSGDKSTVIKHKKKMHPQEQFVQRQLS